LLRAPTFVKHWTRRLLGALAATLVAILMWTAPQPAHATSGRPAGWQPTEATEQVRIGRLTFRYEPGVADEAKVLIANAPAWWSEIERELAGDVDDQLSITFVKHAGRVAEATSMPKWVAGVAHPPSGEIMIARYGPDGAATRLEELLKHEMAHVVLHRATDGVALPRWFHEGVAESFTDTISFGRAQTLATAVFGTGVPDLERLEAQFHGEEAVDASVAYAAVRDLVNYLRARDETGQELRQVLTELRLGHGFEAAFIRAYGVGLSELVGEWRGGLAGRFMWYPLAASGGLPFALLFPLVVIAWIRRRRVLREGWARLERQDAVWQQMAGAHAP
jgi:hypothetical protein